MMKKVSNNDLVEGLVSIIVPVFNSKNYLHKCLKSLINQSYKNIEIILINDGSSDNSGEICDTYAHQDQRIKVIHQKNSGPAAARNTGIENSKGEFIFFVDVDDFIKNDALELLINGNSQRKADLIIGDFIIKTNKSISRDIKYLLPNSKLLGKPEIIDYVKNYLKKPTGYTFFIYVWGKLFRSSIIKKNDIYFNENLPVFEDILFNFEYLKFARSVYYVKKHIYTYIVSNNIRSSGNKICDHPLGYKVALKCIGKFLHISGVNNSIINKLVGNAYIYFAIRTIVRFFRDRRVDLKYIYRLILTIINDSDIRKNLRYYSPLKGDSKLLPILIKLKLVWPIIFVCQYKARE